MTQSLLTLLYLALVTASITVTLSRASIFKVPRQQLARISPFLGKLVSCPYCTSHWVAFLVVGLYRPVILPANAVVNYLAVSFALVTVSSLLIGALYAGFQRIPPPNDADEEETE